MSNNRELGYVVGAVAGYFTGGLSYVAIGATAGGIIGGLLDPKTQTQGPRLDDLKVQFSSYGVGVPRLYGTYRISPNVIWSTEKIELSRTDSQGKGGGGVENTTYSYFVQMRQLYVETPRDGSDVQIVKSFKDGKIIYDASTGAPLASSLASVENPFAFFTLYQGKPDQLPDPVEEIYQDGPGSVPAYRGVVSNSLKAIECPGGRVPQFSHVLSNSATPTTTTQTYGRALGGGSSKAIMARGEVLQIENFPNPESPSIRVTRILQGVALSTPEQAVALVPANTRWPIVPISSADRLRGINPYSISGDTFTYSLVDFDSGTESVILTGTTSDPWAVQLPEYGIESDGLFVLKGNGIAVLLPAGLVINLPANDRGIGLYDGFIYCVAFASSNLTLFKIDQGGSVVSTVVNPQVMSIGPAVRIQITAAGIFVIAVSEDGAGNRAVWKVDAEWQTLCEDTGVIQSAIRYAEVYCTDRYLLIGPAQNDTGTGEVSYQTVLFNTVLTAAVKVSDIIAEECERAGETRYDVSAIPDTDTVIGYVIANPASARANIDPLLTAFQIFIVDEDGLIKFKKYEDIVSVADISFDELGQAEDGAEPSDAMPLARTQEIDLPRSVSVSYIEPTYDYQTATETEVRQVTDSTEDMLVSLPMAITSDQARKAAANILFSLHRRQNTRSLKVSRKFAFLSPGDGTMIEYPRGTWKLWRWINITDTGALIEGTVEPGDAELYSQVGIGATGYVGQQVQPLAPPSTLVLLDMPILRDVDSNAGKYAALKPAGASGWRGSYLLVSADDINFQDRGTVTVAAVTGFAETALEDGAFGEIDHYSRVTVNVGQGLLNSSTWDALFQNGTTNLAALKTSFESNGFPDAVVEIFQFRVAESLGGGRYILSELIRGLYGTERVAFNHQIGDTFVLLNAEGMLQVSLDPGDIGSTKYYKPVSLGRSSLAIPSIPSETIGYGLKPLSPINVKLDRTASNGSIVFTWGRRTRLSHNALRSIMPLGESSEVYEVVIYAAPDYLVVKSVYRVYAPTFSYLAADLSADGYTQSGSIPYRIYQISDAVGRGVPFQPGQGLQ